MGNRKLKPTAVAICPTKSLQISKQTISIDYMENSLGGKRSAKIMTINGETFKLKTPVQAGSVLVKNPGHVLLESEAVRHYGVRAKPLEPQQELKPKRLYFLVQLPKPQQESRGLRRVSSGIHMTAKDRLESLMLARRSASDLSAMKPVGIEVEDGGGDGGVRVRMRLPREEVRRMMAESKDGDEAAEIIFGVCMAGGGDAAELNIGDHDRGYPKQGPKSREKRVEFLPINEGDLHYYKALHNSIIW